MSVRMKKSIFDRRKGFENRDGFINSFWKTKQGIVHLAPDGYFDKYKHNYIAPNALHADIHTLFLREEIFIYVMSSYQKRSLLCDFKQEVFLDQMWESQLTLSNGAAPCNGFELCMSLLPFLNEICPPLSAAP